MANERKNLHQSIKIVKALMADPNTDARFDSELSNYKNPTPKEKQYVALALFLRKLLLKAKGNPPRVLPTGPEPAPVEPPQPH